MALNMLRSVQPSKHELLHKLAGLVTFTAAMHLLAQQNSDGLTDEPMQDLSNP